MATQQNFSIFGNKFVVVINITASFIFAFSLVFVFLFHPNLNVNEIGHPISMGETTDNDFIIAEGVGTNDTEALEDAERNALIQGLGCFIYSETIVEQCRVVKDKIIRLPVSGFVTNVQVVEKKSDPPFVRIKIQCKVSVSRIWEQMQTSFSLLQELLGHRRVVVITPDEKEISDEGRRAGLKELATCLQDALLQRGFRVFKTSFAKADFQAIIQKLRGFVLPELFKEIVKESNDFVVFVDLEGRTDKGQNYLKVNAESWIFGRLLATLPSKNHEIENLNSMVAWEKTAQECANSLNDAILQRLFKQVSEGAAREYLLYFKEVNEEEQKFIRTSLAELKKNHVFFWLTDFSQASDITTVDACAPSDPELAIEKALRGAGMKMSCYRKGNILIFVPTGFDWQTLGSYAFGFFLLFNLIRMAVRKICCKRG